MPIEGGQNFKSGTFASARFFQEIAWLLQTNLMIGKKA